MTREALRVVGVKMPLNPKVPVLHTIRKTLRDALKDTPLATYTALSFGVIGKKA
ncbi:MAG: hypothetical protein HYV29_11190 [Ignavibacteriales bacterium]|nr:hypothetical protein [Ignavibacteriales bacterium]